MCLALHDLDRRTLEQGERFGYRYQIVHNSMGYRCGYVRVLPGHPWFGKGCDDVAADVHGGLTFAEAGRACAEHDEEAEWWIGFDCGHAGDAPDPLLPLSDTLRKIRAEVDALHPMPAGYETVRDQEYVREQCFSLCNQAATAVVRQEHPLQETP